MTAAAQPSPIPDTYRRVTPCLVVQGADAGRLIGHAAALKRPGPYQLQAAIVACHAEAERWEVATGSSMFAEEGDRQFRALDMGVVTEAGEGDRCGAQPG